MIKYTEAKLAFAEAVYELLSESDSTEWFSVREILRKSGLETGVAFASRVLTLSDEEGEIFSSDSDGLWTLDKDGFDLVEAAISVRSETMLNHVPASNRVVRFNHNAQEAEEISAQLQAIREFVRGANGIDIEEQERERVFNALGVATELWSAGNLKLIQIKTGVLLAVEDAASLLANTASAVAASLLVDAIKSFVKNHFLVDLDTI